MEGVVSLVEMRVCHYGIWRLRLDGKRAYMVKLGRSWKRVHKDIVEIL